jgi:nucleotide-binding universal stress UspA family protein
MKRLNKILVPTDLSEHSRRALSYGSWLSAEDRAALVILHVANELSAWEYYSDDLPFAGLNGKAWPADRILSEASLDLTRFLEQSMGDLKKAASASKRVILGAVAEQIAAVADEEKADLIIMSPRRHRHLRHVLFGSVTDTVTRISPCPVLSIAAPLPSRPWRGKFAPLCLPWPRRKIAAI